MLNICTSEAADISCLLDKIPSHFLLVPLPLVAEEEEWVSLAPLE